MPEEGNEPTEDTVGLEDDAIPAPKIALELSILVACFPLSPSNFSSGCTMLASVSLVLGEKTSIPMATLWTMELRGT